MTSQARDVDRRFANLWIILAQQCSECALKLNWSVTRACARACMIPVLRCCQCRVRHGCLSMWCTRHTCRLFSCEFLFGPWYIQIASPPTCNCMYVSVCKLTLWRWSRTNRTTVERCNAQYIHRSHRRYIYIGHVLDYTRKGAGLILNTKICIAIHNYRGYTSRYSEICISKIRLKCRDVKWYVC
jgi:hypothetical protein